EERLAVRRRDSTKKRYVWHPIPRHVAQDGERQTDGARGAVRWVLVRPGIGGPEQDQRGGDQSNPARLSEAPSRAPARQQTRHRVPPCSRVPVGHDRTRPLGPTVWAGSGTGTLAARCCPCCRCRTSTG